MVITLYKGEDGKMYEVDESRPIILTDDDKSEIKRIILDALDNTDPECEYRHVIEVVYDEVNNSFDSDVTEYRDYAYSIYDETLEEYEQKKLNRKTELRIAVKLLDAALSEIHADKIDSSKAERYILETSLKIIRDSWEVIKKEFKE